MRGVSRTLMTGGKRIASEIPSVFDEIYHFSVRPGLTSGMPAQYIVSTVGNGNDFARTALPLDAEIDFTNANFYEIWRSQIKNERS